jgi:hypothetical protein
MGVQDVVRFRLVVAMICLISISVSRPRPVVDFAQCVRYASAGARLSVAHALGEVNRISTVCACFHTFVNIASDVFDDYLYRQDPPKNEMPSILFASRHLRQEWAPLCRSPGLQDL